MSYSKNGILKRSGEIIFEEVIVRSINDTKTAKKNAVQMYLCKNCLNFYLNVHFSRDRIVQESLQESKLFNIVGGLCHFFVLGSRKDR